MRQWWGSVLLQSGIHCCCCCCCTKLKKKSNRLHLSRRCFSFLFVSLFLTLTFYTITNSHQSPSLCLFSQLLRRRFDSDLPERWRMLHRLPENDHHQLWVQQERMWASPPSLWSAHTLHTVFTGVTWWWQRDTTGAKNVYTSDFHFCFCILH